MLAPINDYHSSLSELCRSLALLPAQGNEIDKKYRRALAESLALVELQVQVVEVLKVFISRLLLWIG